jgi:hypothetical protein
LAQGMSGEQLPVPCPLMPAVPIDAHAPPGTRLLLALESTGTNPVQIILGPAAAREAWESFSSPVTIDHEAEPTSLARDAFARPPLFAACRDRNGSIALYRESIRQAEASSRIDVLA